MTKLSLIAVSMVASFNFSVFAGNVGGVGDGGGGGVLVPKPASVQQVNQLAILSQVVLIGYLQAREVTYYRNLRDHKSISSLDLKLYGATKPILEIIKSLKIDLRENEACSDLNGVDVDGSVFGAVSDSICISSYRITPKVDENSAQFEVPALVLHEISHHLGTSEVEAQMLQADFIRRNFRKLESGWTPLSGPILDLLSTRQGLSIFFDLLASSQSSCRQAQYFIGIFHNLKSQESLALYNSDLSWLGARDTDQFEALEVKANAVMELVCSWDKTLSITDAKKHQDNYLQGFSDATVIEAMTYAGRSTWMGFGPGLGLVSAPMKKCADSACVRDELNDLLFALSVDLQSVSATSGSKFTRLRL